MKRTAPYAMFTTFDAPSGEVCVAQRESSNTPLQSLTLLNDPVVAEAAQHFGKLLQEMGGPDSEKLSSLYQRVLGRLPQPEEIELVAGFLADQRRRLQTGELDAQQLTNQIPDSLLQDSEKERAATTGNEQSLDRALSLRREISAWALTARTILNLDEAIIRN
jgi:hypothetical protein